MFLICKKIVVIIHCGSFYLKCIFLDLYSTIEILHKTMELPEHI